MSPDLDLGFAAVDWLPKLCNVRLGGGDEHLPRSSDHIFHVLYDDHLTLYLTNRPGDVSTFCVSSHH